MHIFKIQLLLLITVAVIGCTPKIAVQHDTPPNYQRWQQRVVELEPLQDWSLSGKVGVQTGSKGGSARINWRIIRDPAEQFIELYGPFGGGRVIIESDAVNAILKDAKGKEKQGKDAESLLNAQLGWPIPFKPLQSWTKGLLASPDDNFQLDQQGLLQSTQHGIWDVNYDQYQLVGDYQLPRKLTLTSTPGAITFHDEDGNYLSDQIKIKVIITD